MIIVIKLVPLPLLLLLLPRQPPMAEDVECHLHPCSIIPSSSLPFLSAVAISVAEVVPPGVLVSNYNRPLVWLPKGIEPGPQ
jgi:hypothetical protein